jgi:hypothetical protein
MLPEYGCDGGFWNYNLNFTYHSRDSWLTRKSPALPMPETYSPESCLEKLRYHQLRSHLKNNRIYAS